MRRPAALDVRRVQGCPTLIDDIAVAADHAFLRASWFEAGGATASLVAQRPDGSVLAALPTCAAGPSVIGARAVTGSYWPFRSAAVAANASVKELGEFLAADTARDALGPIWRMGPFYADDPAAVRLVAAAASAGWTRLTRSLGHTFIIELNDVAGGAPWPRPASLKKVRALERQLGEVRYQRVEGDGWCAAVFDALAEVEQASWVGETTDRSGAKFLAPSNRRCWEEAVRDPILASMLSALILRVDERPVAFCFDLNAGGTQYAVASTFDAAFAKLSPGKVVTYRGIEWAKERGITRLDWGAGDSGYKRKFGAVQGSEIIDCLFVANPLLAAMLAAKWKRADPKADARSLPAGPRHAALIATLATAAAAVAMAE